MIACSNRTSQGVSVCTTKFSDWFSILEKVALCKSWTICGGTRKIRQISSTPNCRVERNWLSSGGNEIDLYCIPSSSTATLWALFAPPYTNVQLSRIFCGSFKTPGCSSTPLGCAPFLKKEEPYFSTASVVPRLFFIMAIGENPTSPLNPSPGMCRISSFLK